VILLEQVVVDARVVEKAVGEGYRAEFAQVLVALLVFGQQYQVPSAAVGDAVASGFGVALLDGGVFVVECAVGAVSLDAYDGFEELGAEIGDVRHDFAEFFLQVAEIWRAFGHLGVCVELFDLLYFFFDFIFLCLQLADLVFYFAIFLFCSVYQLFDTEHVAVVGEGHGIHSVAFAFADKVGHLRHSVEYREVRVHV
jgi:hypothetical protein